MSGILGSIKNFINDIAEIRQQKINDNIAYYGEIAEKISDANSFFNNCLLSGHQYLDFYKKNLWVLQNKDYYSSLKGNKYKKFIFTENTIRVIESFKYNYESIENLRKDYNIGYVANKKTATKSFFDNIEGRALDNQQRECIIKDEVNNLVIAGAGSGKTTTIIGKVKYLLQKQNYAPSELLVLSFTNASASEMAERIKKETGILIDVMTFHKLGKEIIAEVEGKQPSITGISLPDFVSEMFNVMSKTEEYLSLLNKFFLSYMKEYKSRFEFKSEGEYIDYLKDTRIKTLKNEVVKSYEEMEIANYLFINNINYMYECKYEIDTADREHRRYTPDFYLPDYKIYIEHFGIDRDGNVPSFFSAKDDLSAKEAYNQSIQWKREIHKRNGTVMIETYSFEKSDDVLTKNLHKKLSDKGVLFTPKSRDEIWELIQKDSDYELSSFVKLIATFITLLKSNDHSIDTIIAKNNHDNNGFNRARNSVFIKLIVPLLKSYSDTLTANNEIDFSDMINKATEYVKTNRFKKKYSYIIVDEYQDISATRYNLIKAIKDQNSSKIFCVGDDWQSIYRFAGSDINLFTNFETYFGKTEKSFIETTYRFNKNLIDLSSRFILKNKSQIPKKLVSYNDNIEKSYDFIYGNSKNELSCSLKEKLRFLPKDRSVVLLGRYKEDLRFALDSELTYKYDHHEKKSIVKLKNRPDLKIEFLTAHKSKGLQADYVFILNNQNGKYGFPSNIEDDKVLNLLIQQREAHEFAEERRLFYVCLTRAKKFVYLLVDNNCKSVFIREIESEHKDSQILSNNLNVNCPKCKRGFLKTKSGKYGSFYGCSNYPLCKHTQKNL